MGVEPKGVKAPFASAGPYYVASWTPNVRLVLKRNPYYKRNPLATRPANVDTFDFAANVSLDAQLLKMKAGEADYARRGRRPSAHADLVKQYGINKGRYQVRQVPVAQFMAMNTTRGIFRDPAVRKAVNLAIDRQAILAQRGYLAGKRADQILPPGMPGYRDFDAYPLRYSEASVRKAKQLMRGRTAKAVLLAGNRGSNLTIPQIVKFNLAKIGIDVEPRYLASGPLAALGWNAGRAVRALPHRLAGRLPGPELVHGRAPGRDDDPGVEQHQRLVLRRRRRSTGACTRRHGSRARPGTTRTRSLDREITTTYAPWAVLSNPNSRDFVSARVGCYRYHPSFGLNLVTVCLK